MRVHIYKKTGLEENYVDLYYDRLDEETKIIKEYLDTFQDTIIGKKRDEETERLIYPAEILYLEIVERKCFLYLKDSEWQTTTYNINAFVEKYEMQGFVRISKSMAVNIYHVQALKADYNMRVTLTLDNHEKIVLNRSYRDTFYQYLNKMREIASARRESERFF